MDKLTENYMVRQVASRRAAALGRLVTLGKAVASAMDQIEHGALTADAPPDIGMSIASSLAMANRDLAALASALGVLEGARFVDTEMVCRRGDRSPTSRD